MSLTNPQPLPLALISPLCLPLLPPFDIVKAPAIALVELFAAPGGTGVVDAAGEDLVAHGAVGSGAGLLVDPGIDRGDKGVEIRRHT